MRAWVAARSATAHVVPLIDSVSPPTVPITCAAAPNARSASGSPETTKAPGRGRIYNSITDTIGDTPLVKLNRLPAERGVKATILAKLEFFNPISSVKDRIGVNMIDALEASGALKPGGTLIEPT